MRIWNCILSAIFLITTVMSVRAATNEFDFNNFTITDSGNTDLNTASVSLNDGAKPITVNNFDIAGIMLGMSFDDVETLFFKTKGLYSPREKDSIIYSIQKDWKYNLDYECRQQGIYAPADLDQCIKTLARDRGLLYAAELHLLRENTGETIVVYFTSNASDNVVWRVLYNNDVNEIEGDHEKFADQREKKILAFWQAVLDKYGAPNSGTDKWISTTNAYDPVMTAYYGSLDLVDNGLYASDMAKNVQQARENFQSKPYAF
ncbi:MAG: hypothetical protein IAC69_04305 [Proteobacteria bacterium]|uniref:Uncharacterized protein n=1 Tax=Candidatus Enterousia avistercoris TaxID=2840788 RepID=A0A9D9DED8_9PROT|nr:hypothetical protein [Candidatus Enterousia avistercoris]